jgi:enamine deaminase RidA (YjgF/YER057c/UK114 family)
MVFSLLKNRCMKHFLPCIVLLLSFGASAQKLPISKTKFHWGRQQDTAAGYTQAILTGNVLYISGTVGRGQTMADQLKSVYEGIEQTLKHYGATFQQVVKENLYTTDIEATKAANYVRKPFYKGDFPAATWVQISRLYMSTALVEVEVIAHLPSK